MAIATNGGPVTGPPGRMGYVYVASHYRWTPSGYVFVPGYWDLVPARRGVFYAPVVVDPVFVVRGRFVYTPYYAVPDTLVLDAMFVRPATCHYYFGDYYGPRYVALGFESSIVYSRRHYDPIIVYQRWEYRDNPRWFEMRVNLVVARDAGRAPLPPRTLVQQTTVVNNVTNVTNVTNINKTTVNNVTNQQLTKTAGLAPAKSVMASQGIKSTPVDQATRAQIKTSSQAVQQTAMQQRQKSEVSGGASHNPGQPHTASFSVPPVRRAIVGEGNRRRGHRREHQQCKRQQIGKLPSPGTAAGASQFVGGYQQDGNDRRSPFNSNHSAENSDRDQNTQIPPKTLAGPPLTAHPTSQTKKDDNKK